jgi:hypothetical protein
MSALFYRRRRSDTGPKTLSFLFITSGFASAGSVLARLLIFFLVLACKNLSFLIIGLFYVSCLQGCPLLSSLLQKLISYTLVPVSTEGIVSPEDVVVSENWLECLKMWLQVNLV